MLELNDLQNLLHTDGRSNHDRTLLCLGLKPLEPRANSKICEIAKSAGWSWVKSSTVSTALSRARGLAISTPQGWQLTDAGKAHVAGIVGSLTHAKPPSVAVALRKHLPKIKNAETASFVEEAVLCFEHRLFRSAVVMSWVGAVHLLYEHVVANQLAEFNAEATKRTANAKNPWKAAKTIDDLTLMKEAEFLEVLQAISVVGKNVKAALRQCLDRRNACGHPNSYKLSEAVVAAHVEELLLNVYEQFA